MTVGELIEELQSYPRDAQVYAGVFYFGGARGSYNCEAVGKVELIEDYRPGVRDNEGREMLAIKLYSDGVS